MPNLRVFSGIDCTRNNWTGSDDWSMGRVLSIQTLRLGVDLMGEVEIVLIIQTIGGR